MEGETYTPPTAEEQEERRTMPKILMLDSIEVSRNGIRIFTKLISSMPPLEEQARTLIFSEQDNIRKEFDALKEWYKNEQE